MVLSTTIGALAYRIKDEEYKEEHTFRKGLFEDLNNAKDPSDVIKIVDKCIGLYQRLDLKM